MGVVRGGRAHHPTAHRSRNKELERFVVMRRALHRMALFRSLENHLR
jgi:hypothetical protein